MVAPTVASVAAHLAQHRLDDRADFDALKGEVQSVKTDMGSMEVRLGSRIDGVVNSVKPKIDSLLEDKMRADERAKVLAEVSIADAAKRVPNPWVLGAWQGCAGILFGLIIAWLAHDQIQGPPAPGGQSTRTISTTSDRPAAVR